MSRFYDGLGSLQAAEPVRVSPGYLLMHNPILAKMGIRVTIGLY
jgi:hypothetical protein